MFTNHLKVAFRSIWNNKFYSAISIVGLAIGITAGILILLWCQDEKSYNTHINNSANIYRAVPEFLSNGDKKYFSTTPAALGYISKQVSGIDQSGRVIKNWEQMVFASNGKNFVEKRSAYIDASLFTILDLPFIEGNRSTPFQDRQSLVTACSHWQKYICTMPMARKD